MKNSFYAELSRRLAESGIESVSKEGAQLEILLHAQPVLYVSPGNDIFLLPAGSKNEEANDLYHQVAVVADEVYEYVEAMQGTPILHASGLNEVLAGRERENGQGYQFVTWTWDYGRRGVSHGHYYEGDFQSAKQDFAVRSGLISKAQLFSPEQLTELYRATDFLLEEGPAPEEKHLRAIQEARTKIEYVVPDLQSRLEQTQEQGQQMNI